MIRLLLSGSALFAILGIFSTVRPISSDLRIITVLLWVSQNLGLLQCMPSIIHLQ